MGRAFGLVCSRPTVAGELNRILGMDMPEVNESLTFKPQEVLASLASDLRREPKYEAVTMSGVS